MVEKGCWKWSCQARGKKAETREGEMEADDSLLASCQDEEKKTLLA